MVYDGQLRPDILTYIVSQNIELGLHYHFKIQALNYVGKSDFSPMLTSLAAVVPSVP